MDAARTPTTLRTLAQLLRTHGDEALRRRHPEPVLLVVPFGRPPAAILTPRSGVALERGGAAANKLGATRTIDARGTTRTRAGVDGASPSLLADRPALDPEQLVVALVKSDRNPFGQVITVGRARSNDVALDCPEVSKVHAWIRGRPRAWRVSDNASTNGTFVESVRLDPRVDHDLVPGMAIRFGPVRCRLVSPDELLELCAAAAATA